MSYGSLLTRLLRGASWTWQAERHRQALPPNLGQAVYAIESADRHHAKQGRSTCRVRFDGPSGPLSVYLKRHERLPLRMRLAAMLNPAGKHSPASAEWDHLERVRALGVAVPEVVAAGETIGPWGRLRGFLMVAELTGSAALNEVLPDLAATMEPAQFSRFKRELIAEMAAMTATLHRARVFHKDLYLCHFYLDLRPDAAAGRRLTLIDLHRLARHRWTAARWRAKDLAQLLFSTDEVGPIDDRDRLRFWMHYRRRMGRGVGRWEARLVRAKAARYRAHNR